MKKIFFIILLFSSMVFSADRTHPGNYGDSLQVDYILVNMGDSTYVDVSTFLKNITVTGGIRGSSLDLLVDSVFTEINSSFFEVSDGKLSLKDSSINNNNISATAAIAGTKISPNFGSQNITTTGYFDVGDMYASGNSYLNSIAGMDWSEPLSLKIGSGAFSGQGSKFYFKNYVTSAIIGEVTYTGDLLMEGTVSGDSLNGPLNGSNLTNSTVTWAKIDTGATGFVDARKFGFSTSANAATNTTAFDNALAYATSEKVPLILPSGTYNVNTITIEHDYEDNVIIRGSGRTRTILSFTGNGFRINTSESYIHDIEIADLTITSPAHADTGIVMRWCSQPKLNNVYIDYFQYGIHGYKVEGLIAERCYFNHPLIGVEMGTTVNNCIFLSCYNASTDSAGYVFNSVKGIVILGGECTGATHFVHMTNGSVVTVKGGNFESCDVYGHVSDNSNLYFDSVSFQTSSGGLVGYLDNTSRLYVRNILVGGWAATDSLFSFESGGLVVAQENMVNKCLYQYNRTTSTKYRLGPLEARADNAAPSASATYRGEMVFIYRRPGNAAIDDLAWIRQTADATYETVYLSDWSDVKYSITGASHARNGKAKVFVGRKNFTASAAGYTDVQISIIPFTTIESAVATVMVWQGAVEYRVQSYSHSTTGGTYTFRVFHPDDMAGTTTGNVNYQIVLIQ